MNFSHRRGHGLYIYLRDCMFSSHVNGTLGMTGCIFSSYLVYSIPLNVQTESKLLFGPIGFTVVAIN